MTPDTQKWSEMSEGIVEKICVEPEHRQTQRMTPWFQEYVLLVENALASVAAEAAHEASQSVLKAVEEAWKNYKGEYLYLRPEFFFAAARLAASNYPAPINNK